MMLQSRQFPKSERPLTGRLVLRLPGAPERVLEQYKSFPILQNLKKQYIAEGYPPEYLKITY